MLLLRTFGGLGLTGGALPPAAAQLRRLALLVLLARAPDGARSRDSLMALLWPESSTERARHALDQLLYATRRDLGRDAILSEPGRLRLNPERVLADCCELDRALDRGERAAAVEIYSGPFLDGVHFDDAPELERWVARERDLISARVGAALERLAVDAERAADVVSAAGYWMRRAALDPLGAATALRTVEALERAGDPEAALQYARRYCALVEEELGIEPDRAVRELADRIERDPLRPVRPVQARPAAFASHSPDAVVATPHPSGQRPGGRRARIATAVLIAAAGVAAMWLFSLDGPLEESAAPPAAAHALWLRGKVEWNRRSRDGLEQSVVLFRGATEHDPASAEAHAGLAEAYVMLGYHGFLPANAAFPKGKAAALTAIALDSTRGDAHAALGVALQAERRWREAEDAFTLAIRHSPEYATAHQWYALLLTILGRGDDAVRHARIAAELDPLSIQVNNTYGIMLYNAGLTDSAVAVYERIVTQEPDTAWVRENPWVLSNFGKVASRAGRHEEAIAMLSRALHAVPGHPRLVRDVASVHLDRGDTARARQAIAAADTLHPQYRLYRALMQADLGDVDAAFASFEQVRDWGLPSLLSVSGPGALTALRTDPRYPALRRRLGLPD